MLCGFVNCSILGRAVQNGLLQINLYNLRDWAKDKHHTTDDSPYGGGAGMVLKPEPIFGAVEELKFQNSKVVYMCPDGEPLTTSVAKSLAQEDHMIILSGHYEGVDERVRERLVDREISIGNYVLTNGTLAAAILIDVVSRYVPGVLGDENSLNQDSFSDGLLSFPQYTRPAMFRDMAVPDILMSGNHAEIAKWRSNQRVMRTKIRRPDLICEEEFK
jgi:tRNA (guanine37-N1)-methyltransferase